MNTLGVEEEKNMRATLSTILAEGGYAVAVAATGEYTLDLCKHHTFDVVLLNIRMQGLNGVDAFGKIRRHQAGYMFL